MDKEPHRFRPISRLLTAAAIAFSNAVVGADSPFAFRETNSASLQLSEKGQPVFVYNFGGILASNAPEATRRSTYLHPVYAPDGTVLTDDFNPNHPHHRGIFWAWEVVAFDGKTNDVWTVKGFRQKFVRWQARETSGTTARLAVENGWYDGERKFVKEDVEIVAHPTVNDRRQLDFTLSFEATDKPVVIVGTPVSKKGYGGFAFRTAPRDSGAAKTIIRTDEGVLKADGVMARHPWAELLGTFQGKKELIRIEDDAANPGYPKNGWLLRHGFALLNVSYPGLEPLTLQPGKPLVLKYRVILSSGKAADRADTSLPQRGICAHRGASATHPENTLPAFEEAIRLGAQMIEFDVWLSKDGMPVVMHDATVDRTTGGKGKLRDLTLDEIKQLDAGRWKSPKFAGERVPTLAETLAIMPDNIWLNVHLKEGAEAARRTAEVLVKSDRVRQAFLACTQEAATAARTVAPGIRICNMSRQGSAGDYVDHTIQLRSEFIQLAAKQLPNDLAAWTKRLKEHGVAVNFFGLEQPEELRALFQAGVDFPLVNDVAAGMKVAAEFGISSPIKLSASR